MQELTTFISNHPFLNLAAVFVFLLVLILELVRAKRNTFNIGAAQAVQLINHENAAVIDIRQIDTYRQGHIIDAHSIPVLELQQHPKKLEKFKNRPLIIVSNSQPESQKIAALLLKQGYNAYSLRGGMRAWSEAQMPLIKE